MVAQVRHDAYDGADDPRAYARVIRLNNAHGEISTVPDIPRGLARISLGIALGKHGGGRACIHGSDEDHSVQLLGLGREHTNPQ